MTVQGQAKCKKLSDTTPANWQAVDTSVCRVPSHAKQQKPTGGRREAEQNSQSKCQERSKI